MIGFVIEYSIVQQSKYVTFTALIVEKYKSDHSTYYVAMNTDGTTRVLVPTQFSKVIEFTSPEIKHAVYLFTEKYKNKIVS